VSSSNGAVPETYVPEVDPNVTLTVGISAKKRAVAFHARRPLDAKALTISVPWMMIKEVCAMIMQREVQEEQEGPKILVNSNSLEMH
jgi:hypothetical protein